MVTMLLSTVAVGLAMPDRLKKSVVSKIYQCCFVCCSVVSNDEFILIT